MLEYNFRPQLILRETISLSEIERWLPIKISWRTLLGVESRLIDVKKFLKFEFALGNCFLRLTIHNWGG